MGIACSAGYGSHTTTKQLEYVHEMYFPMNVVKADGCDMWDQWELA